MELDGRTIVITGAGRGLGAAAARRLARLGCRLALVDRDLAGLGDVCDECRRGGSPEAVAFAADVSVESDVQRVFNDVAREFGEINGLVNNAGITRDALTVRYKEGRLVSKMSLEEWQAVIDVNLTGVFLCGREAACRMIEKGTRGCIINISSISRHGNTGQVNYSASKAGVAAMAVVWAREFARYGIRAASIAPGFFGTDMVMSMNAEMRERVTGAVPAGRVGDPDEIARTVQFILENDYVNGRCLEIDGGLRI